MKAIAAVFVWIMALILFIVPVQSVFASTNSLLTLNDSDGEYEVIPYLQVIEEAENRNSIHDMLLPETWASAPLSVETPNFGYDAKPHWARFQIRNESSHREWLMQIDYPRSIGLSVM